MVESKRYKIFGCSGLIFLRFCLEEFYPPCPFRKPFVNDILLRSMIQLHTFQSPLQFPHRLDFPLQTGVKRFHLPKTLFHLKLVIDLFGQRVGDSHHINAHRINIHLLGNIHQLI